MSTARSVSRSVQQARTLSGPHFETHGERDGCVVAPSGELDMACVDTFQSVLAPMEGRVVVDLSAVTFLDSSAISVLVAKQNQLRTTGGALVVRNPHSVPRQVLELTGLGDWIVD